MTFTNAIEVSELRKNFQKKEVLSGLSFSVPPGKIYTLLGANGAGKTTTIRILTTQIKADSGNARLGGYDISKAPRKVREIISLTGQFSAVDESLTGSENLIMMGKLRQLPDPQKAALGMLDYFELLPFAKQVVSKYSGGMKRKLDLAMSLLGNPKVLFLDEPTTGLDPQSRRGMWEVIRKLKHSGMTVFLTTQYLEEAERLSDQIAILNKGKVAAKGTPMELKSYLPRGVVQFILSDREGLKKTKALLAGYRISVAPEELKIVVFTDGDANTLAKLFRRLSENGVAIRDFSQLTPALEDVFLTIINENQEDRRL